MIHRCNLILHLIPFQMRCRCRCQHIHFRCTQVTNHHIPCPSKCHMYTDIHHHLHPGSDPSSREMPEAARAASLQALAVSHTCVETSNMTSQTNPNSCSHKKMDPQAKKKKKREKKEEGTSGGRAAAKGASGSGGTSEQKKRTSHQMATAQKVSTTGGMSKRKMEQAPKPQKEKLRSRDLNL